MDTQTQRVVLETDRHRIVGELTMPREGYRSRISDFLNQGDLAFVALTDATVIEHRLSGSAMTATHEFIAVGTDHIQLAYPDPE